MYLIRQVWREKLDKGIVIVAQNNSNHDYVEQAAVLAMSVKKYNNIPVSIITDDEIPVGYKQCFDKILPIEWGDMASESDWKVENRWKVYHQSPYNETIVMDTDMLVTSNIDHLWDFYKGYDLFFTTKPVTYRGEVITSNYYREFFEENNLPNIYCALYYFKKSNFSHAFFEYLEYVVKYFHRFQRYLCPKSEQDFVSMDVAIALTIKLLDIEDKVTNNTSNVSRFVHMKPHVQNWKKPRDSWQKVVPAHLTNELDLYIGNIRQTDIFHYTEKDFLRNVFAVQKYKESENE